MGVSTRKEFARDLTGHQLFSCSGVSSLCSSMDYTCQSPLSFTNTQSLLKLMPLSRWYYLTVSSSAAPFSFCLHSFPVLVSFPMSWLFESSGQSIGVSASASVLPMNIQEWFPLGLTDFISMQSKGLSRVFTNTTVQKHQLFKAQPSLWSRSHIHTWLLDKP